MNNSAPTRKTFKTNDTKNWAAFRKFSVSDLLL